MSARGLSDQQRAALAEGRIVEVVLLELQFPEGTERLASTPFDWEYDGYTWRGGIGGAIEAVKEAGATIGGLKMSLSGISPERIAQVQLADYRFAPVVMYVLSLNPDTYAFEGSAVEWSGQIDTMTWDLSKQSDGRFQASVTVMAEHEGQRLKRSKVRRFTNDDHQARFPGDRFYELIPGTAQFSFVWPSKEFFKQ
jgi:hypothetical protein